ncbi:MAG TPA: hypothetical protein VHB98_00775 [Chloroflexota bacterium]|jgi:hypothetical protein|nr:hypothetical protein [Chloroflexota bacterium]
MDRLRHSCVAAVIAVLVLAALIGGPLASQRAEAAIACRSDPVLLVDGALVDIVSVLQTAPTAVRELDYTVTVPSGSLTGTISLTLGLGFPEKVTYVFSSAQRWGTLKIAATVITQSGVKPFPTTVQASSLLASASASGQSNQTVIVSLANQIML